MAKQKLPKVTISCAMSFDGKLAAKGRKIRFSDGADWERQYMERGRHGALLIGVNSVGDHSYSSRGFGKDPVKVILDSSLKTKPSARIFGKKSETVKGIDAIIFYTHRASKGRIEAYNKLGRACLVNLGKEIKAKKVLEVLAKKFGVKSVLVEGGGKIIHSFLSAGLFDKIIMFVSPVVLAGNGKESVKFASGGLLWPPARLKILRVYRQGIGYVVEAEKDSS
ncbi:hypothetical protein FJZ26_03855 [Candidatus Parvarchaeota archaeon]|nr:hypothetical protein [Candidatus Parvarchaeota archaeon]